MTSQPSTSEDYSSFDKETLLMLEEIAAENLKFYQEFQKKLEEMDLPEDMKPMLPRNTVCVRECELRLEMIRKAISTIH